MYIAMKYIGRDYSPGDILPDDLPKEQVEWLKEAGAIIDTAPFPRQKDLEEHESPAKVAENVAETAENVAETAENAAETAMSDSEAAEEAAEEVEAEEMEPEAPVIDVMDGVVSEPAKAEKPKKKRGNKGGAKRRLAPEDSAQAIPQGAYSANAKHSMGEVGK